METASGEAEIQEDERMMGDYEEGEVPEDPEEGEPSEDEQGSGVMVAEKGDCTASKWPSDEVGAREEVSDGVQVGSGEVGAGKEVS
ncbi:hypothetical protein HK097_011657 [Rhizophlyctis rosea]|uniref:Uncharacterized protein n=1 Tax=Rhizophlyctis rosea TaxID=64517 RepID=A0AAD5S5Y2_9FUNG|nr:hypothetical protein HK097_011657 [Rhizophlyctis rosea]